MATQTSQTVIEQSRSKSISRLWTALIKPDDSITGDDRRRAMSLSALTLVFIPLAIITVFLIPIRDTLAGEEFVFNSGGMFGVVFVILAYALSRTKYFYVAAYLMVAIPALSVFIAALSSEGGITESSLIFISLSVILSSLLLTSRATIIAGVISIIVLYLLYDAVPRDVNPNILVTFTLVTTGVLALISRLREQNIEALEKAQSQLKEQIIQAEEARDRAERSDQVKSAFLASMSHELRTPLNAIINFTRFVSKGTLGPVNDEQVETLDNVIVSGKHLLNLINDVLDMAKIESGSLTLFVSDDVAIHEVIKEVGTTGRALLAEKPVELKVQVEETLPQIRGDHQRIRQILLNLVSNACKFTDTGTITILAKQENSDIRISVIDTGCGIAKKDQAMVFDAFKQTEDGLRQGGGTGLGMPITKSLIEAHGGTIELESKPGHGTTFHIRLPIKSETISPTLMTEV